MLPLDSKGRSEPDLHEESVKIRVPDDRTLETFVRTVNHAYAVAWAHATTPGGSFEDGR